MVADVTGYKRGDRLRVIRRNYTPEAHRVKGCNKVCCAAELVEIVEVDTVFRKRGRLKVRNGSYGYSFNPDDELTVSIEHVAADAELSCPEVWGPHNR